MDRSRIALIGFDVREITSIHRTASFYLKALAEHFEYEYIQDPQEVSDWDGFDAAIDFSHYFIDAQQRPEIPILYCLHGTAARGMMPYRQHGEKLRSFDRFLVNCSSDKNILEKLFPSHGPLAAVLHLPVAEVFSPLSKTESKKSLGLTEDVRTLGFVGRLYPQKNLHQFINILSALRAEVQAPLKGIVIGEYCTYPYFDWYSEQEYRDYIDRQIQTSSLQQHLIFFDHIPPDEKLNVCYNALDVLVHPTNVLDENFGYVPLEAMACGVPVIGNGWGGLKDTVLSGVNGFLMPTWVTQTGLRSSMRLALEWTAEVLTNDRVRNILTRECLHRAKAFSFENSSLRLREIIDETIRARRLNRESHPPTPLSPERDLDVRFPIQEHASLPHRMNDWRHQAPVSAHYASAPIPLLTPLDFPSPYGPVTTGEDGRWLIDDPCWPASFSVDEKEKQVLSLCNGQRTVLEISHGLRLDVTHTLEILQKFCDSGLISI